MFRDTLSVTIYDDEHSDFEERWVTVGRAENGQTLLVIHTFTAISQTEIRIRLISARVADHDEKRDYENSPQFH